MLSFGDIKTITLVGSTRFPKIWKEKQRELTLAGYIVHTVGLFGHQEGLDMSGPEKKLLDRVYLKKIFLSDAILVLNVDGYIGLGAWDEIFYAVAQRKEIRFLNPIVGEIKDAFVELCRLEGWSIIRKPVEDRTYPAVIAIEMIAPKKITMQLRNQSFMTINDEAKTISFSETHRVL